MTSQLDQDDFVLSQLNGKRDGYFVEFGACDGLLHSNTLKLEQDYGWRGILAEPAHCWQPALQHNRKCNIDFRAIWPRSGETIIFAEAQDPLFSTAADLTNCDMHAHLRASAFRYQVNTVSLDDLLAQHQAPPTIDYLSVDTEGSELDILAAFSWRWRPTIITVEHNYARTREGLFNLLSAQGYSLRQVQWEDWYTLTAPPDHTDQAHHPEAPHTHSHRRSAGQPAHSE